MYLFTLEDYEYIVQNNIVEHQDFATQKKFPPHLIRRELIDSSWDDTEPRRRLDINLERPFNRRIVNKVVFGHFLVSETILLDYRCFMWCHIHVLHNGYHNAYSHHSAYKP